MDFYSERKAVSDSGVGLEGMGNVEDRLRDEDGDTVSISTPRTAPHRHSYRKNRLLLPIHQTLRQRLLRCPQHRLVSAITVEICFGSF